VGWKARRESAVNEHWGLVRDTFGDKRHLRLRSKTISYSKSSQFFSGGSTGIDVGSPRQQRARRPTSSIFTEQQADNITSFISVLQSQTSGTPTKNSQASINGLEIHLAPEMKVNTNSIFSEGEEEDFFVGRKSRNSSEVNTHWGLVRGSVGDKRHLRQRARTICQTSQFSSGRSTGGDVGSPRLQQRARRPASYVYTDKQADSITSFIRRPSETSMKPAQPSIKGSEIQE
jgi:hypothetical protein